VLAVKTTAANCHDSKPLLDLLDKTNIQPGTRIYADRAYSSEKHRDALKSRSIKNGIQDKATNNCTNIGLLRPSDWKYPV